VATADEPDAEPVRHELHTNRGQAEDGTRQTIDPSTAPAPAPALTAKSGAQWVVKSFRNNNNACERTPDEPAGTLFFGGRSNWAAWQLEPADRQAEAANSFGGEPESESVVDGRTAVTWTAVRPSTTVQGDARIGRPGHKDRDKGESQFAAESVRIQVWEAAVLQSFPADYPWQGSKTKQYEQAGNAWCPRAAAAVLGEATGMDWAAAVSRYYGEDLRESA
jgi:DNA (cytosine-5)-methyltransferase 1